MATRASCALCTVPVPGRKAYVLSGGATDTQPVAAKAAAIRESLYGLMGIPPSVRRSPQVPFPKKGLAVFQEQRLYIGEPGRNGGGHFVALPWWASRLVRARRLW